MNESEQTPLAEWRDLSPSEAALLAQTARLSPEERFNVLLSLWSFWHAVSGTARERVSGVMRSGEHEEIDLGASELQSQPQHLTPDP